MSPSKATRRVEFKLRFSIFQMLQAYRPGDSRLSIGAKFLSGEHYSGHYFWDTDNFLTPFYLLTMPEAAQDLVEYRVRNLEGARAKARGKKFRGAFYPWEACPVDGRENCPEWWKDKAAQEPVYIPCGNIELHINAAVALSAARYLQVAGRPRPSRSRLHRMLVEIARFWASRGAWENGRFSIKNVIGPDEYHEYVDDNAYTNHTARWCLQKALSLPGLRGLGVTAREEAAWRKIVDKIELGYDAARGILAQDRTFLSLPELDRSKFKPVIPLFRQGLSMEEIGRLQAIKQADVLALFHQLPFTYDHALMQRCWDYYEPRTVHDSNLSAGSHAVVAALLGRVPEFRTYYDKVLNLDIGGESYNVVDGLHAANAGNAWSATIMGAAGIRWTDDALCCTPRLLPEWRSLRFPLVYRGRRLDFRLDRRSVTVTCAGGRPLRLVISGQQHVIGGKAQVLRVSREPVAVVFDLDGVLVDSAVCHFRAWKKIADELGVKFDERRNDLLRGVSRRESLMILLDGQLELSEDKIQLYMAKKNDLYKQLVNEAGEELLLPGVKPFLSRLRAAGIKLAVASSSRNTPDLLKQAGLDRYYFDAVADGNDIRKSKPHPEVFLLAARRLGVRPNRCVCVEDAPAGIEAGRRAGMKTLGIGPAELGRCDWRRPSIAALTAEEMFGFLSNL
jgi:beta-phosphoglucomutase